MEHRLFTVAGRKVSVELEAQFGDCLEGIAVDRDVSLKSSVSQIGRQHPNDISSALRLHVPKDVLRKTGIDLTAGNSACDHVSKYH